MSDLCPICPRHKNPFHPGPIYADGPTPCRVLFIGEGPAKDEVRLGRPFVGRAGKEFNYLYLPLAGLDRSNVRVTNATLCPMPRYDNPTKEQAMTCSEYHLAAELRRTNPEVVVPMGAVACSLFENQIDLETQHGIPFLGELLGIWSGVVFPTYHPAIGLHEGLWMQTVLDDFKSLGETLRAWDDGVLLEPEDEYPDPDYRELDGDGFCKWSRSYEAGHGLVDTIAMDTEVVTLDNREPYCFSFSPAPGHGYVVYMDRPGAVREFRSWVAARNPLVVFHNYLFDAPVCEDIGIPVARFEDTMVRAYHLQRIPRGLKPLAYRLCGMRMSTFEEVVEPYSKQVVGDYLIGLLDIMETKIFTRTGKPTKAYPEGRPLKKPRRRPGFTTLHARTYNKVLKLMCDLDRVNPWDRWRGWHQWDREFCEELSGPMPDLSIVHCPRSASTPYSAADADATIRIWPKLKSMATELRHTVTVS